mgnify:CR=1 FL=1
MKSINYTYEESARYEYGKSAVIIHEGYSIIGLDGNRIAECYDEDNAVLIVAALNGTAP